MEGRPGEEFFQEGLKRERAKDMAGAIAFYKKAEKLGHPLTELEEEAEELEQSYSRSLSLQIPERCRGCVGPVVVGIGGPTRSGKSTLTESLCKMKDANVVARIHQDHYFTKTEKMPKVMYQDGDKEEERRNWEVPESIIWVEFIEEIQRATQKWTQLCPIHGGEDQQEKGNTTTQRACILVEGFLLYSHPLIFSLLDKKVFITLDKEECYKRRLASAWLDRKYFDTIVWASYEKHIMPILNNDEHKQEFLILKGENDPQTILDEVIKYIAT